MSAQARQSKIVHTAVLFAVLALSPAASAAGFVDTTDRAPYIFTQQHNISTFPQIVRRGWPLQVQLPGNPTVWSYNPAKSRNVVPRGKSLIFSPGRIEGTQSIFVFDFAVPRAAKAGEIGMITIETNNPPKSLFNVIPGGVYQIKFTLK